MFAYLKGKLVYKGIDYVVIDVGGVGYKVFSTVSSIPLPADEEKIQLFTHLNVRENEMTIYGFAKQEELQLFELLITVSGIGPKVALNILNHSNAQDFIVAVMYDDEKYLTKLPGIGKKTAKRILLELKEKLQQHNSDLTDSIPAVSANASPVSTVTDEAIAALSALGYDITVAKTIVHKVVANMPDGTVEQILKQALRSLATL